VKLNNLRIIASQLNFIYRQLVMCNKNSIFAMYYIHL